MGDADEGPLVPQALDGLLRGESGRYLCCDEGGQDLTAGGHDLLADDDQFGVESMGGEGSGEGVVVGDDDPVQIAAAGEADEVRGGGEGIFGGGGVGVEVNGYEHGDR